MSTPEQLARDFLAIADQFRLGELPTEQPHPLTAELSRLAQEDLPEALRVLQQVDALALEKLAACLPGIEALAKDIGRAFMAGRRVFIAGCGATGRLALTLETLCREGLLPDGLGDRVVGFMAGGDSALIRSLEGFEDYPEYGARQLMELGYAPGDLLIGVTEGGETPFVIGATEAALVDDGRTPWFCYCNPDEVLCRVAERSKSVLENEAIRKLPIVTGPMALAGSTRMQATTVQMAAVGMALKHHAKPGDIAEDLQSLRDWVDAIEYAKVAALTETEAKLYQSGGHVLYRTRPYGMTVLTDTTERAPTFSLPPFENDQTPDAPLSLCYLSLPKWVYADTAWSGLLGRLPRTLNWPEVEAIAGTAYLLGFDISGGSVAARTKRLGSSPAMFEICGEKNLSLQLGDSVAYFDMPRCALLRNLCLKMLLNAHSTLVMGRLGRYEGNLMTWVKPSNNKLIDRAIRYVRELYRRKHGTEPDYADVCRALFIAREDLRLDEPIVLKTLALLSKDAESD